MVFRAPDTMTRAAPMRPASRSPGDRLADDDRDEPRIPHEVSAPHAARLLRESVEPLEPHGGHPARRSLGLAGDEVEARPDAEDDRRGHRVANAAPPDLLLRRPEREKEKIGLRRTHRGDRIGLLGYVPGEVDVRRAHADDPDAGELALEDLFCLRRDARATAEEIDAPTPLRRAGN